MRGLTKFSPLLACLCTFGLVLAACGSDSGGEKKDSAASGGKLGSSVTVAYDAALSGFLAPFDGLVTNGSKLAVKEINAKGGIGGKTKIDLQVHDMKSDAATAVTVANQLIEKDVDVILPGCNTDFQVAVASTAARKDKLVFSPCNADPTIAKRFTVYYPTGMAGNYQTAALADYVKSKGYKNIYMLDAPDFLYVATITKYFTAAAKTRGLTISGKNVFKIGQTDFSPQVTKIKNAATKPDAIVTGMFTPDIATFVKQLRAAGIDVPVLGTDGADSGVTLKTGGSSVDGLTFTTFAFPTPDSKAAEFVKAYADEYGNPPDGSNAELGYDVIYVLAAALEKAQSTDPAAIGEALKSTTVDGSTGKITYPSNGDHNPMVPVSIVTVKGGKFAGVDKVSPEDVPAP